MGLKTKRIRDAVTEASVLKMPEQRASKLLDYLEKYGSPEYFNFLEVVVNEYGDLILGWERRQYEVEITIHASGPLQVYEDVAGKHEIYVVPTIRSAAGAIHSLWKKYMADQRIIPQAMRL